MKEKIFENILIVSDMDGTFLGERGRLVQRNLDAIEDFKARGGKFTFATGRTHHNICKAVGKVSEVANAPAITVNGACIYDFLAEKSIKDFKIDSRDAMEVARFVREHYAEIGMRCSTDYGFLTDKPCGLVIKDFESFLSAGCGVSRTRPVAEWESERILKIVFRGEAEELLELRSRIEPLFSHKFQFVTSSPRFLEMNARGCSKAVGIEFLRNYYGGSIKVYAVGDYENDIEMLKAADVSVCPANSLEAVKKISDICLCDCRDGVIAELYENIICKNG